MVHRQQGWMLVTDLIPGVRGLSLSLTASCLGDLGPNPLNHSLCIYIMGIRLSTLLLGAARNN